MATSRRLKKSGFARGRASAPMSLLLAKLTTCEQLLQKLLDNHPALSGPRVVHTFSVGDVASESFVRHVVPRGPQE